MHRDRMCLLGQVNRPACKIYILTLKKARWPFMNSALKIAKMQRHERENAENGDTMCL